VPRKRSEALPKAKRAPSSAERAPATEPSAKPAASGDPFSALRASAPPRPARFVEVLEAALALVSEHGIAGASLRKLASRLGMSQPSLYHYFPSKEALISEIVDYSTSRMLRAGLEVSPPTGLADLPRFAKEATLALYATESHPRFVRLLFLVAIESPEHRAFVERMFEERLRPSFGLVADAFSQDPHERAELRQLVRMIVYSLGFMLLEERALFGKPVATADTLRYAEWAQAAAESLIRARFPAKR